MTTIANTPASAATTIGSRSRAATPTTAAVIPIANGVFELGVAERPFGLLAAGRDDLRRDEFLAVPDRLPEYGMEGTPTEDVSFGEAFSDTRTGDPR